MRDLIVTTPHGRMSSTSPIRRRRRGLRRVTDDFGPGSTRWSARRDITRPPRSPISPTSNFAACAGAPRRAAQRHPRGTSVDDRPPNRCIVAVTSELAIGGGDSGAGYAAAKGAIIGLVRSRCRGRRARGTGERRGARPDGHPTARPRSTWRAGILATLPARRLARPEEIAEVVRYLAGDDAGFCTGEVFSPNSGAVIWMSRHSDRIAFVSGATQAMVRPSPNGWPRRGRRSA